MKPIPATAVLCAGFRLLSGRLPSSRADERTGRDSSRSLKSGFRKAILREVGIRRRSAGAVVPRGCVGRGCDLEIEDGDPGQRGILAAVGRWSVRTTQQHADGKDDGPADGCGGDQKLGVRRHGSQVKQMCDPRCRRAADLPIEAGVPIFRWSAEPARWWGPARRTTVGHSREVTGRSAARAARRSPAR